MKNKFSILSIILTLGFIISACGNGDNNTEADDSNEDKSVTLKVIMEQVPDADIVESMLSDFYEEHSNIELDIETLPFDQMREKIIASSLSPDPVYDIIVVDNPWMYDFASEGHLEPLNEMIEQEGDDYNYDDFAPPLKEIAEVDNEIYAIPFYNYALALTYRKDLFDDVNLEPPTSTDELEEAAEELTDDDMSGIAMQPESGYRMFEPCGNWSVAEDGETIDDSGEGAVEPAEARSVLEKYIAACGESATEGSTDSGVDEAQGPSTSGEAGMMTSYD